MPCLLVNVGQPRSAGLFTYTFNDMVNTAVCDSDTPVELAKIVPMKQLFFFCTAPRNAQVLIVFINVESQLLLDSMFQK